MRDGPMPEGNELPKPNHESPAVGAPDAILSRPLLGEVRVAWLPAAVTEFEVGVRVYDSWVVVPEEGHEARREAVQYDPQRLQGSREPCVE